MLSGECAEPIKCMKEQLGRFGHRQAEPGGVFLEQYPLIHMPTEYVCRYEQHPVCQTDADGDGLIEASIATMGQQKPILDELTCHLMESTRIATDWTLIR